MVRRTLSWWLLLALFTSCGRHSTLPGSGAGGSGGTASGTAGSGGAGSGGSDDGSTLTGHGGAAGSKAGAVAGSGGGMEGDAGAALECVVGGKSYPDGATDIPAADGCNSCWCNHGQLACTLIACGGDPSECVLAQRLNTCCGTYEPHARADLAADECLVPYPATNLDSALVTKCQKKSPVDCTAALCAPAAAYSRIVKKSSTGACVFADECSATAACVSAYDSRACCHCPQVVPEALLAQDHCFTRDGSNAPAPAGCNVCMHPGGCLCVMPHAPSCVVRDSFSICE